MKVSQQSCQKYHEAGHSGWPCPNCQDPRSNVMEFARLIRCEQLTTAWKKTQERHWQGLFKALEGAKS